MPECEEFTYAAILNRILSLPNSFPVLRPKTRPSSFDSKPIPRIAALGSQIAALSLHPVLETLLHILNADLASAHFYVRHMQSPPSYDGMILHALLHRYEGDLENARAWYGDITGSSIMQFVWGGDESTQLPSGSPQQISKVLVDAAKEAIKQDEEHGNRRKGGSDGKEVANEDDPTEPGSKAAKGSSPAYARVSKFLDQLAVAQRASSVAEFEKDPDANVSYAQLAQQSEIEVRRLLAWCEAKYGTQSYLDTSDAWVRPSEKIQKAASDQMMGGEGWRDF